MKHKVKLVQVEGETITLKVDGVLCSYLIQRPEPLTRMDAATMRLVMDTSLIESVFHASNLMKPSRSYLPRFFTPWRQLDRPTLCDDIADYIERVGVEVSIGEKGKGIVLLKSDVDKVRKGEV